MLKRRREFLWVMGAATALAVGCGGGDDTSGSGGDMGTGGSGGSDYVPTDINRDCPDVVGADAQQGECCYRNESNTSRFDAAPDGDVELEYRMNWQYTINHPNSLTSDFLKGLAAGRNEDEQQSLLVRFTLPKENDELVAGSGVLTMGQGRYNCDGTYSFYTTGAAPVLDQPDNMFPNSEDSGRWEAVDLPADFDPALSGRDALQIAFEDRFRGKSYTPFLDSNTYEYDWEIVTEFLDLTTWDDISANDLDCVGNINADGSWNATGEFTVFARIDDNMLGDNGINALGNIYFGQLVAFGILSAADFRDTQTGEMCDPATDGETCRWPDPLTEERCDPATADCKWLKLPDSLCPESNDERDIFSCHVGYEGNPDGRPTNCTATAPTTPRNDPDGDEGQCCDPLGQSTDLPACNAYLLVNEFVAASAQITDEPVGEIQQDCR